VINNYFYGFYKISYKAVYPYHDEYELPSLRERKGYRGEVIKFNRSYKPGVMYTDSYSLFADLITHKFVDGKIEECLYFDARKSEYIKVGKFLNDIKEKIGEEKEQYALKHQKRNFKEDIEYRNIQRRYRSAKDNLHAGTTGSSDNKFPYRSNGKVKVNLPLPKRLLNNALLGMNPYIKPNEYNGVIQLIQESGEK